LREITIKDQDFIAILRRITNKRSLCMPTIERNCYLVCLYPACFGNGFLKMGGTGRGCACWKGHGTGMALVALRTELYTAGYMSGVVMWRLKAIPCLHGSMYETWTLRSGICITGSASVPYFPVCWYAMAGREGREGLITAISLRYRLNGKI
jgi:hypothetical protein